MAAPLLVGDTGWVFDNNMQRPPYIDVPAPPGAAVGDRIILIVQRTMSRTTPGVTFTVPAPFTFVWENGYTPVPGSSHGWRVYSARMTAGMFPLSVGAQFVSPAGYWKARAVAYRPSFAPGDGDGDGNGNMDALVGGGVAVSTLGEATVLSAATWALDDEAMATPNGFTLQVSEPAETAEPDPSVYLSMSTEYDPDVAWPTQLVVADPPPGTMPGDEISVFLQATWEPGSWPGRAGTGGFVLSMLGANGSQLGTVSTGGSTLISTSPTVQTYSAYRHISYAEGLFPLTINFTSSVPGDGTPGVGGWGVRIVRSSTRREPNEVGSTFGRLDSAQFGALVVPDSTLSPAPYAPARGAVMAVHMIAPSDVASGTFPNMGTLNTANGFTQEAVASQVTGRLGGFVVSMRQNFTGTDTATFQPPVYNKTPAATTSAHCYAMVMFPSPTGRGGGFALADRTVPSATPSVPSPVWNKAASQYAWTTLIALDDPDPSLGGGNLVVYRDGRVHAT